MMELAQMNLMLPAEGFARLPQVLFALGISRASLWRGVKSGKYPQPIKLGTRTTVWRVEDIRAFIASQAPTAEKISTPKEEKGYGGN